VLQWRDRAGFAPASLLTEKRHEKSLFSRGFASPHSGTSAAVLLRLSLPIIGDAAGRDKRARKTARSFHKEKNGRFRK